MSSELIERLRDEHARNGGQGAYAWQSRELCGKAAEIIAQLQAELAEAREVPGRIAEYLRDPYTVMDNMALWIGKTKAGFMTSRTKGDLGIVAWFTREAAAAIEARDWSKP